MDMPLKLVVVLLCFAMVAGWKSFPLQHEAGPTADGHGAVGAEPLAQRVARVKAATPLSVPCVDTRFRVVKVENRSKGDVHERYIAIDFPAAKQDDLRMIEAAREVLPEFKREVMRAKTKIRMAHIAVFEDADFRYRGLAPAVTLKWAWIESHEEERITTAHGADGTYERKSRENKARVQKERFDERQRLQLERLHREQQQQQPLRRRKSPRQPPQTSYPWLM